MKTFNTIAKTSNNDYGVKISVSLELSAIQGVPFYDYQATLKINGKEVAMRIDSSKNDRIYATPEFCKELGIEYKSNIALRCDFSEATKYVWNERMGVAKDMNEIENSERLFNQMHNL